MNKNTHILGGVALAIITKDKILPTTDVSTTYNLANTCIFFACSTIFSVFPDIDKKGSYISRKLPTLSKVVCSRFKHRSFTHSLTFLTLLNILLAYFKVNIYISCGITVGILSHILLDILNPTGVEIFYPIKGRFHICRITTGGQGERFVSYLLSVFITLKILGLL